MIITDLRITQIAVGDPPLLNAAGLHAPYALRIIVEVLTDADIVGLSEIPGSEKIFNSLVELKPYLIGQDVFELNSINALINSKFGANGLSTHAQESHINTCKSWWGSASCGF